VLGARSIPLEELKARLKEIPKTKEIVAYCRGPYCVFADEAVALLRSRGRRAMRLETGVPDWKAKACPSKLQVPRHEDDAGSSNRHAAAVAGGTAGL
jgi:rhodanese-related sulfurtransferase